jgi:hypothetical protein
LLPGATPRVGSAPHIPDSRFTYMRWQRAIKDKDKDKVKDEDEDEDEEKED